MRDYQGYHEFDYVPEGVILQIVMDPKNCYAAHPFGHVYSKDHELFGDETSKHRYNGEEIDPFMTFYEEKRIRIPCGSFKKIPGENDSLFVSL
jgi:hypothetical protein